MDQCGFEHDQKVFTIVTSEMYLLWLYAQENVNRQMMQDDASDNVLNQVLHYVSAMKTILMDTFH